MAEFLSKLNIVGQEQYDALVHGESELYLVPDVFDKVNDVVASSNIYTLNLSVARNFTIQTIDSVAKSIIISGIPTNDMVLGIKVLLDYKTAQSINFPKTFWKNGIKPTFVVGNKYFINLESLDKGETFFANVISEYDMTIAKDDFNRADGLLSGALPSGQTWESVGGTWNITGQKLVSNTVSLSNFLITNVSYADNISLQASVYIGTSIDAGLVFRYLNATNYAQVTLTTGRLRIQEMINGVVGRSVFVDKPDILKAATTVALKVEVIDSTINAYLNNELILTQTLTISKNNTKCGFKHYNGATVTFDDFLIKKL